MLAAAVGVPEPRLDISGTPPGPRRPSAARPRVRRRYTSRNPELLAALARASGRKRSATRAIEAETRPNLFLSGALSGNAGGGSPSSGDAAPDHGLLPLVPNWDVGLVLSWPLFDATAVARADKARLVENADREESNAVWQRIVASVEQAYVEAEAARDSLPVLRHTSDAAVANYEQANARFEVGLGNAVELADAEELRTDAEIQLALGTFDLARTRAVLSRLAGEAP